MKARGAQRLCASVAVWLLAAPSAFLEAADSTPGLDQLMSLLAQRRHGEADFTEEKYLSLFKQPLMSAGELIYDAPDHLEERTRTPRPQSVILDHGVLSMRSGSHAHTLRLADYPALAPLIDSILSTLSGDRAALERLFEVQYAGTLDHWQLHLTPRDSLVAGTLTQIDLQGERDAVHEVRVQQRDGDRSIMHIAPRE
jgi:hypothetical protein